MSRAAAIFAAITTLLEDMHAVAAEGQAPGLSPDEVLPLIAHLRADARRLEGQIVAAGVGLNQ